MIRIVSLLLLALCMTSCGESTTVENEGVEPVNSAPLKHGIWRLSMDLGGDKLPFTFDLTRKGKGYTLEVINHTERISVKDVTLRNDSIFIQMPVFNSEFRGKINADSLISGNWHNFAKGPDYFIPFVAQHGEEERFAYDETGTATNAQGNWEVTFSPNTEEEYKAIGQFKQYGVHLTGTFITETGDYRYLDGVALNDSIYLSCFDGAHAFLFKAALDEDSVLQGQFWSGKHWSEPWTAELNEEFELRNPDSLTYLKDGAEKFEFTFPDLDSTLVSLDDKKYMDKVVIIQIMGSWCPNCLDETRLYVDLYNEFNTSGLEIISLAYEHDEDFGKAAESVSNLKNQLHATYDFLIAGTSNKKKAAETLPMLNHVMSYPTSIFIDRNGKIRKIHTGFYGPGTGDHYTTYVYELKRFLQNLLDEEI
jgi:thiol-disulfide isomerase/thioredoxin